MRSFSRALVLLLITSLLAACGSVPRPFSPDAKTGGVPPPGPATALIVHPAAGEDRAALDMLTDMVIEELRAREVAAIHYDVQNRYRLVGQVTPDSVSGGTATMRVSWQLQRPDGTPVDTVNFSQDVGLDAWRRADSAAVRPLAQRSVGRIAPLIGIGPAADEDKGPRVIVEKARGAPGDGNTALAKAMTHELKRFDIAIDLGRSGERLPVLRAQVSVRPMDEANELVEITWLLHDAEGRERGRLKQQNRVASGRLDLRWGIVAKLAAAAAAPEIADLLRRISR